METTTQRSKSESTVRKRTSSHKKTKRQNRRRNSAPARLSSTLVRKSKQSPKDIIIRGLDGTELRYTY